MCVLCTQALALLEEDKIIDESIRRYYIHKAKEKIFEGLKDLDPSLERVSQYLIEDVKRYHPSPEEVELLNAEHETVKNTIRTILELLDNAKKARQEQLLNKVAEEYFKEDMKKGNVH